MVQRQSCRLCLSWEQHDESGRAAGGRVSRQPPTCLVRAACLGASAWMSPTALPSAWASVDSCWRALSAWLCQASKWTVLLWWSKRTCACCRPARQHRRTPAPTGSRRILSLCRRCTAWQCWQTAVLPSGRAGGAHVEVAVLDGLHDDLLGLVDVEEGHHAGQGGHVQARVHLRQLLHHAHHCDLWTWVWVRLLTLACPAGTARQPAGEEPLVTQARQLQQGGLVSVSAADGVQQVHSRLATSRAHILEGGRELLQVNRRDRAGGREGPRQRGQPVQQRLQAVAQVQGRELDLQQAQDLAHFVGHQGGHAPRLQLRQQLAPRQRDVQVLGRLLRAAGQVSSGRQPGSGGLVQPERPDAPVHRWASRELHAHRLGWLVAWCARRRGSEQGRTGAAKSR